MQLQHHRHNMTIYQVQYCFCQHNVYE